MLHWYVFSAFHDWNVVKKDSSQIDDFTHPKTKRQSKCYRLNYRSMDRSLSNEEVNELQDKVQERVVTEMGIEIR
jgi:phenylalanyl-tRNA synthetase alpha chain